MATGALLATMIAGCGGDVSTSSGGGGAGGQTSSGGAGSGGVTSNGGSTATGGTTGTGGAAQALADQGITQSDCAPNDGPAVTFRIGTASICNDSANSAPQAHFLVYPANLAMLAAGTVWDSGTGLYASFFPSGTLGGEVTVDTAHIEVVNVTAVDVRVSYTFTANGTNYAGEATLLACEGGALCG